MKKAFVMLRVKNSKQRRRRALPCHCLPECSSSTPLLTLPSHLYSQDAKDNEEGAADDHDVADGLQRRHQSLHHQLQPRRSADHTETQRVISH